MKNFTLETCLERADFGFTTIQDADTGKILEGDYCDICGCYYEVPVEHAMYQMCPACVSIKSRIGGR